MGNGHPAEVNDSLPRQPEIVSEVLAVFPQSGFAHLAADRERGFDRGAVPVAQVVPRVIFRHRLDVPRQQRNAAVALSATAATLLAAATVGAALRYQHSQDESAVGLHRQQSPGDAEDRYQGNEGERDAEAKESARRVPTRLHHHQVRLMAERVEERKRDARADQRE